MGLNSLPYAILNQIYIRNEIPLGASKSGNGLILLISMGTSVCQTRVTFIWIPVVSYFPLCLLPFGLFPFQLHGKTDRNRYGKMGSRQSGNLNYESHVEGLSAIRNTCNIKMSFKNIFVMIYVLYLACNLCIHHAD